jgi:hypothetical protein
MQHLTGMEIPRTNLALPDDLPIEPRRVGVDPINARSN